MPKTTTFQTRIQQLRKRLIQLPTVAESAVLEVMDKESDLLEDLNKKQLRAGLRSDDSEITPYYRNISYKGRRKPVDLRNTGAFYASITVTVLDNSVEYDATNSKTAELQAKYGKKILGLSEGNKKLFFQRMIPNINKILLDYLTS
jgi:hypothetical protein